MAVYLGRKQSSKAAEVHRLTCKSNPRPINFVLTLLTHYDRSTIDNVDMGIARPKNLKGQPKTIAVPKSEAAILKADGAGAIAGGANSSQSTGQNDSFNKHYNKELKVSEGKHPALSLH